MSALPYAKVQSVSRPPKFGLARGLGTVVLWLLAGVEQYTFTRSD